MKSTQDELNDTVKEYFQELEAELNKHSEPYGQLHPGGVYMLPQIYSLGGGQVIPKTEDAFNLDSPIAGMIKDSIVKPEETNRYIIRRLMGYNAGCRLIGEPKEVVKSKLRYLVKEMLLSLEQISGVESTDDVHGQYARFERPGQPGLYFKDDENMSAFEIRLWSDIVPVLHKDLKLK